MPPTFEICTKYNGCLAMYFQVRKEEIIQQWCNYLMDSNIIMDKQFILVYT